MSLDTISAPLPEESEWHDTPPPRRTWVWMRHQESDDGMLVKTCNSGCCAYCPGIGNMMLPDLWRNATIEEIVNIEAEAAAIKEKPEVDIWDSFA